MYFKFAIFDCSSGNHIYGSREDITEEINILIEKSEPSLKLGNEKDIFGVTILALTEGVF